MPSWTRHSHAATLSTEDATNNKELIHNNPTTAEPWTASRLVIVDGFVTLISDTDNLCGCRLLVVPEDIVDGDIDATNPEDPDPSIYYSFFFGRGPMVFRLRSKKTIGPNDKLWVSLWKESGTDSTIARAGLRLYVAQVTS